MTGTERRINSRRDYPSVEWWAGARLSVGSVAV